MRPLSVLAAADEAPSHAALIAGGAVLTWGELGARARQVVTWLEATGLPRSVAVVPRLDVDSIVVLLALIELEVPIIAIHPRLTDIERAALLADAAPDRVLFDASDVTDDAARLAPRALGDAALRTPLREFGVASALRTRGAGAAFHAPALRESADLTGVLAILYTSGTTGTPKGAVLERRAFLAAATASAMNLGWTDDDRWLLALPLAHVGGLSILVRCLVARRCLVLAAGGSFDPDAIAETMRRDRVTLASFVPAMLQRFTDRDHALPRHVRAILLGGAGASPTLLDDARRRRWPVLTTYGLTEACSQVTTQRYGTPPDGQQGSGEPIDGIELRIASDDRIEIRGPTLLRGYHRRHDHPFTPDGFLRTEDFGALDGAGRLHVLGRRQELLVTGGENVYPLEVERALEAIAGIDGACVFGAPDATWGDIVCAALVLRAPHSREALRRAIRERLAPHKRPRRIALVACLPTTPAGKLDRQATASAARPLLEPL